VEGLEQGVKGSLLSVGVNAIGSATSSEEAVQVVGTGDIKLFKEPVESLRIEVERGRSGSQRGGRR
jgi:hypothetical protein